MSAVAQSPDEVASLLIGDVMTRDVITTRPSTTVRSALSTMHSRGIRRLPVVSVDGRLEGLIAFDDILEVTSEEQFNCPHHASRARDRRASLC